MAQGVLEMKETHVVTQPNLEHQVQYFLDRFYLSRISIRMVMSQHGEGAGAGVGASRGVGGRGLVWAPGSVLPRSVLPQPHQHPHGDVTAR